MLAFKWVNGVQTLKRHQKIPWCRPGVNRKYINILLMVVAVIGNGGELEWKTTIYTFRYTINKPFFLFDSDRFPIYFPWWFTFK